MTKVTKAVLLAAFKRARYTDERLRYELNVTPSSTLKAMKEAALTDAAVHVWRDAIYRVQVARALCRCGLDPEGETVQGVLFAPWVRDQEEPDFVALIRSHATLAYGRKEPRRPASRDAWLHVWSGGGTEPWQAPIKAVAQARCWGCRKLTHSESLREYTRKGPVSAGEIKLVCEACFTNTGRINLAMTDLISDAFSRRTP
jgi:hypothetical protein